ncbi:MAG: SNF2-related protein [Acidobacteriota bacterium]
MEKRCSHEVAPAARDRGKQYAQQRRVKIDASDDYGLNATVRGAGRTYEVQIDWFDSETSGILTASCQCPSYLSGRLCKHIWATLVTADQRGLGKRIPGSGDLQVFLESNEVGVNDGLAEDLPSSPSVGGTQRHPEWREQFKSLRRAIGDGPEPESNDPRRRVHYRLNVLKSLNTDRLVIDLFQRMGRDANAPLRPLGLTEQEAARFTEPSDHEILNVFLATAPKENRSIATMAVEKDDFPSGILPPVLYPTLLPRLCATGRFGWISGLDDLELEHHPLEWQGEEPWEFLLEVERVEEEDQLSAKLTGRLSRDEEMRELSEPLMLRPEGIVVFRDAVAPFVSGGFFPWVDLLRRDGEIGVPESQIDAMLEDLWSMPALPPMDMPVQWQLDVIHSTPRPGISFGTSGSDELPPSLDGRLWFDYEGTTVRPGELRNQSPDRIVDRPHGRLLFRDLQREADLVERLGELGLATRGEGEKTRYRIPIRDFPDLAKTLIDDGWVVEAEDRRLRQVSNHDLALTVSSSVDWFELEAEVEYGSTFATLPALLAAIRRGETYVRLDDGTLGLLPEEWMERYSSLAASSAFDPEDEFGSVRFLPSQTLLLDHLLGSEDVDLDRQYERMRDQLQAFDHLEEAKEPRGFRGELRTYQREGLGWLKFLKDHGFGGCLADDMGLGKTVQVLALLQMRRVRPVSSWERLPSIIVVPRSLVHNWIEEAARFTPKLRLLNYTGPGREEWIDSFDEYDVVVTTYGTLRRDIEEIQSYDFDYAILDEAQAIKNASSQAAKACRQLSAQHRLALTGTPVENHLGELWSIFEFLNPGMLRSSVLRDLETNPESLATVSAALKPFIFRRTKEEVLDDLPAKTELTLYCELEGEQLQMYKDLRDHYRRELQERIEQVGLKKSKIQVLEALLRLRQAACHPGLIDEERVDDGSAKVDAVLRHLEEVIDEGHKALVFSQFTSLLSILRRRIDPLGIDYEYLDGRTRRRQERVARFQEDPDCRLFLISLKAGGVGLNLTAADYVFILDPWWNPAVEAQAVDRAHRIGQTRPVFAYRLISRGTVEEKIMELQGSKKQLADAILSADKSLIGDLSAEDLKVLLS